MDSLSILYFRLDFVFGSLCHCCSSCVITRLHKDSLRRARAQDTKRARGPDAVGAPFLGPEPGPISMMAEHMGIKGKQEAIDRQSIGNIYSR